MDENHIPCAGVYHLFDQSNTRDLHYESSDQCYHPCLEQPCPDRYKKFDSDDATNKLFKPRSIQAAWILESMCTVGRGRHFLCPPIMFMAQPVQSNPSGTPIRLCYPVRCPQKLMFLFVCHEVAMSDYRDGYLRMRGQRFR